VDARLKAGHDEFPKPHLKLTGDIIRLRQMIVDLHQHGDAFRRDERAH
jgi:hypothetical protein